MTETILWRVPAVVVERRNVVVNAVVNEKADAERFALLEFPPDLQPSVVPGFTFWWSYVEDLNKNPPRFFRIERR